MYHTTGWRRVIGSPKLQIIFHKRATKYGSLLWKMTYTDKGSYESWPPFSAASDVLCTWFLYTYINLHVFPDIIISTVWCIVIGRLIFTGHFPQKSPIISGCFAEDDRNLRHPMDLQHPVSLSLYFPIYIYIYICIYVYINITCTNIYICIYVYINITCTNI